MALTLPTSKVPPKKELADYTILLYGEPKIGKSTFASQFDKPLFLATEAGLNSLEAYQMPITSWEDFLEAGKLISDGKHDFKTIVIDTVDNLAKYCSDYILKKNNVLHESDLDFGKAYTMESNEFLRVITKLGLLPYGLFLISHAESKDIKTRTTTITKALPTLTKTFRKVVLGMADIILYAHTIQRTNKEGVAEEIRVLRTKAAETWEAGDRTGKLPEALPFSYEAFRDAWTGSIEGGKNDE
jgi:hypothetical protein